MSLWRVKHTLSPIVEYALVAMVAAYGLFGIYLSSLRPFIVAMTVPVTSLSAPVPLEPELWTRHDNSVYGYAYAAPPGWLVDDSDPDRVRLGRSLKEIGLAGREGEGLLVESIRLHEGKGIEDAAAADFAGHRTASYDVSVDGRPALFVIEFERARIARAAVYVPLSASPLEGESAFTRALVVSAARADLAVFAMFLSDIRFYSSEDVTPDL